MSKNFFQDMVEVKKQTKNKLTPKDVEIKLKKKPVIIKKNTFNETVNTQYQKKDSNSYGLWIIAVICLIVLFFTFSSFFAKAYISIHPKIVTVNLNETITANRDLSISDEGLSYQLVILEAENIKNIEGGEEEFVDEKAKGSVILYNAFSKEPQTLNIDTRLESASGKIYKTDTKVVIPGLSEIGIPGSVEVGITALEGGESYNDSPNDFIISSFNNTLKKDKFYGRSNGPIVGGFKGMKKNVNTEQRSLAQAELEENLKNILLQKAREQIPEGYVLFKDATFFKFDSVLEDTSTEIGKVPLLVKGVLYGFLFKETDLVNEIMNIKFPEEKDRNLYIKNLKNLNFSLTDKDISFIDVRNITFKIAGSVQMVSFIKEDFVMKDLIGKEKKDFKNILSNYKNIHEADLTITPIWQKKIPSKSEAIKIKINYPE
jgi:hypothetical protein